MAKTSLKDAKDYIAMTIQGKSKKDAALAVFGRNDPQTIRTVENSEAYAILYNTMVNNNKLALAKELESVKLKSLKSASKLLDQGDKLLDEATTLDEKIKAAENQRRNIDLTITEKAADWAGPERNKGADDILEGIIVN